MTTKAQLSEEEWARLKRAPFIAGMAISIADPGGPIEGVQGDVGDAQDRAPSGRVRRSRRARRRARPGGRRGGQGASEPAQGWHPKSSLEIVDELSAVNRTVSEKATPRRGTGLPDWLLEAAKASAEAAKEGGFFGFKAEVVSEGEQRMLDRLPRGAVGVAPTRTCRARAAAPAKPE